MTSLVRGRALPRLQLLSALFVVGGTGMGAGCGENRVAPDHPTWSDVAPVLRGECGGCHGWTASDRATLPSGIHLENTGGNLRFDFYDVTADVCGDAALARDPTVSYAGAAIAPAQIGSDVVSQNGARWPRMPPQPSPALPPWEIETITRWAAEPVKGPPPAGNRPPDVSVSHLPASAAGLLAFTAIIEDPDGDSAIGVIEAGGSAFLMNRPGSFAVRFDVSSWAEGPVRVTAVVCDGWESRRTDLGPVQIRR